MTKQWSLAVAGVVYSTLTAAAMWQTFSYRMPFLFDPWSETAPPPPTLLNAMIAISVMIESASILAGLATAALGRDSAAAVLATSYGACALLACLGVLRFLRAKQVPFAAIARWAEKRSAGASLAWIGGGLAAGVALGGLAHLYLGALAYFPDVAQALQDARQTMRAVPHLPQAYFVMAVAIAPFAEEFLFRGLLYRALDREWGGVRAVAGAAAFFAVYHPLLAWPPVFALGVLNTLLFRRGGSLAPSVAAHIAYNAVVLGL
jgi:membrane protease YdiL (CAAX protease family)